MSTTNLHRVKAIFGINKNNIAHVLMRAQAMHDGMAEDPTTYATPNPLLPAYLVLIQNLTVAQQQVRTRVVGATANRNVDRDLLLAAMGTELSYVQSLADANAARAIAIIQNAGLLVSGVPAHTKAMLTLKLGALPGTVACIANTKLLTSALATKPKQQKCFNWQSTIDGGKTIVTWPTTPTGKTILTGFAPFVTVGVRVSITGNVAGPGPWSQVVSILVTA